MNNMITEMKNTVDGMNSRINEREEWVSELKDRLMEITTVEQKNNKKKRIKRNEDRLRDLCVCVCVCARTHTCSVAKSYPILCDLMDCSLPGSSAHRII